jgi:hypothetical protein
MEVTMPFYVEVSKVTIKFHSGIMVNDFNLLGKLDNGDYEFIGSWAGEPTLTTKSLTISTTKKYNCFRYVFTHMAHEANVAIKQLQLYGDVYSAN